MGPGTSNPATFGYNTSTYGNAMERKAQERRAKRFADALRDCVEHDYCLGGASDDEIRAAYADFLHDAFHMFVSEITTDVEVPSLR